MSDHFSVTDLIRRVGGQEVQGLNPRFTPERALHLLQKTTGQDFGYDAEAWTDWLEMMNKLPRIEALKILAEAVGDTEPYWSERLQKLTDRAKASQTPSTKNAKE